MTKAADAFRTISEVADDLGIPKHVLRFWEAKFAQIRPMKRGGGRRYYRPEDLELLKGIQQLLHRDGYTIKGVQKILREQGVDAVKLRNLSSSAEPGETTAPTSVNVTSGLFVADKAKAKATIRAQRSSTASKGTPVQPRPARAAVIAAAIAELEACRAVLSAAARSGSPAVSARRQSPSGGGR